MTILIPTTPIAVALRCQADRDFIIIIANTKGSSLDPSSDQDNLLTTKVGIDATALYSRQKRGERSQRFRGKKK